VNRVIESLLSHRTIRAFRPARIDDAQLDAILEAGTRAATSFQPYSFLVIDDPEILEDVAMYNAPIAILVTIDVHRFGRYLELHGASKPTDSPFYLLHAHWDALIALQNVVVAAESLGLGTVFIGRVHSMDLRKPLGLPENVCPAGLVLIGHPTEPSPGRPRYRVPLEAVVHRNRYREPTDEELEAWYGRYKEMFDKHYEALSDEEKEELAAEGIENGLQRFCHQEGTFFREADEATLRNLQHGGFHVADWGTTA